LKLIFDFYIQGTDDDAELEPRAHYEQVPPSVDELKIEEDEEYRQLPDPEQFHGEPVCLIFLIW